MTRIWTFCVVSSTLAVLAMSANGASAEISVTTKVVTPTVKVTPPNHPQLKVQTNAPMHKLSPNAPMDKTSPVLNPNGPIQKHY